MENAKHQLEELKKQHATQLKEIVQRNEVEKTQLLDQLTKLEHECTGFKCELTTAQGGLQTATKESTQLQEQFRLLETKLQASIDHPTIIPIMTTQGLQVTKHSVICNDRTEPRVLQALTMSLNAKMICYFELTVCNRDINHFHMCRWNLIHRWSALAWVLLIIYDSIINLDGHIFQCMCYY